jgi:hypothetical protein
MGGRNQSFSATGTRSSIALQENWPYIYRAYQRSLAFSQEWYNGNRRNPTITGSRWKTSYPETGKPLWKPFLFAKEMKLIRVPISAINSFRHSRSDPLIYLAGFSRPIKRGIWSASPINSFRKEEEFQWSGICPIDLVPPNSLYQKLAFS